MEKAATIEWMTTEQDRRISAVVAGESARLRNFIRRHVADRSDAEDILQDVFYELVEAYRLMKPVEQVTAWMFRVARNRIIDLFRKNKRQVQRIESEPYFEEGQPRLLEELLPSSDAGPDSLYLRNFVLEALGDALEELPAEQRDVFIAHELMGYTFKELAEQQGVGVNTLISRKHYAVQHLRARLQAIYDEFKER